MAKTLYIIDGHAHIYSAFYAPMRQQLTSPSGEPTKATYIFTTALLGLIETKKPDMLVVAMDSKEPSFRVEIYPEYKAHRPPMPDEMPVQIERIEQILEAMNIPMLRRAGFEADDIIGTLAKKAAADGNDVFICSKDKDMLQLLNDRIFAYDIKTNKQFDAENMKSQMGIGPEQFVDVLALQGDTADNVPGVPDVGPKTAVDWIKQYGSLENLYEHADEIKGKRGDNLRNSRELAYLSKELVTIKCDMPIDLDYAGFELAEFDKEKLAQLFGELGFSRLMAQLGISSSLSGAGETVEKLSEPASAKTVKHSYELIDSKEKLSDFAKELKKQKLFAFDTETTSVYPSRAELVGLSFCWEKHKAFYLPVKGPMGSRCLDAEAVREKIASIMADEKIKKIGQNIKYDLIVMHNAQMPVKGVYFDTMVASYVLAAERRSHSMDNMATDFLNYQCITLSSLIGKGKNQLTFDMIDTETACEYSSEDADITFQLYEYLHGRLDKEPKLKKLFEEVEMPLVSVLTAMELNGVSIDVQLLKKMSVNISDELEAITTKIYEHSGSAFNIDSPKQLAEVLFDRLGLESVRNGKTGRSTDVGVLEQLKHVHPIIEQILQYRQLSKLKNTYVDKLGVLISPKTNRIHASFNQTITATGRLSSSDPNLQNIPIRTPIGRQIRSAFVPGQKTDCIVSADYSQIELRLLAHFSKDKALLEAFENDQDIHSFVASQIYGVAIDEVTSEMRSHCKAINFGIIYGQGAFGLSRGTDLTVAEAKKFIDDYFARYKSIRQFMDEIIAKAKDNGFAETILNRRRKISDMKSKNFNKRSQAERLAINTVIQGSAADLIKVAMINIQRQIEQNNLPIKMILQIHDELVFEVPITETEKHAKFINDKMTGALKLDVPLKVDISIGSSWLAEK